MQDQLGELKQAKFDGDFGSAFGLKAAISQPCLFISACDPV
jgi:hypothetical protein